MFIQYCEKYKAKKLIRKKYQSEKIATRKKFTSEKIASRKYCIAKILHRENISLAKILRRENISLAKLLRRENITKLDNAKILHTRKFFTREKNALNHFLYPILTSLLIKK